jgi:hypothetical protein
MLSVKFDVGFWSSFQGSPSEWLGVGGEASVIDHIVFFFSISELVVESSESARVLPRKCLFIQKSELARVRFCPCWDVSSFKVSLSPVGLCRVINPQSRGR